MFLWAEASRTVVYVQKRCPDKIVKNMTLEEAFTGVKPKVGQLRIFGCPVYIHVPKEKRTKVEPSSKKGTFVGYSKFSKAYGIYIRGSRHIEVSRDVTFEEEMTVRKGRGSDMEINDEEMERRSSSPPIQDELAKKDEPIDPVATVDIPEDMEVS